MILGIDASTYFEELQAGANYFCHGEEVEPLSQLHSQGVGYLRIRVWKNPYDKQGKPYLGGTCDYDNYRKLAKLGLEKGYQIVLDPHFSDFWCDPGKQFLPKDWANLDEEKLLKALNEYAHDLFLSSKKDGINPAYIQLGNEITNGMMWPYAQLRMQSPLSGYDKLVKVLKIISSNAREVFPKAKLIIHLEKSNDNKIYREFFDNVAPYVDFDIIGMSYYPYWHGSFKELFINVNDMKARYGKPVMIMETGYGFTLDDYLKTIEDKSHLAITDDFIKQANLKLPCPLTPEGQASFIKQLLGLAKENGVVGVFYWEPFWIPGKDICWSSKEGLMYTGETNKGTRNEWANQALYDYQGHALPGLYEYQLPKGGK